LICFFCFEPSSSPTQLDFFGPSSALEKQDKILTHQNPEIMMQVEDNIFIFSQVLYAYSFSQSIQLVIPIN